MQGKILQKVRENLFPVKYCDGKKISFSSKVSCHRVTRITHKRLSSPENNSVVNLNNVKNIK